MPTPGEHKTVQARIIAYAQQIGWTYVFRAEAERRRGFDPDGATPADPARTASPYIGDLVHAQVLAFNPKYKEAEGALIGEWARLRADTVISAPILRGCAFSTSESWRRCSSNPKRERGRTFRAAVIPNR